MPNKRPIETRIEEMETSLRLLKQEKKVNDEREKMNELRKAARAGKRSRRRPGGAA